jgi:alanyl-tRNA synthetase
MAEIEELVNEKILEAHKVETLVMSLEEAQNKEGLKMYFGDKYGETVRAVIMDDNYSQELCGGTHVSNTSEIGFVKITSESSIASGIRRIEAISGAAIPNHIRKLESDIANEKEKEANLQDHIKRLEKEISDLKTKELSSGLSDVSSEAKDVNGISVVAKRIDAENMDQLRDLGDELRKGFKENGIGLLGTVVDDKVQLVCVVSDDIKNTYPAGKIVGEAAKFLGGGGGGKPHLATAGGKDVSKFDELLATEFVKIVASFNK